MLNRHVYIIGMPGSGKSTVGAALAALTGREAIDIDARIAEKAGCSIPEIFAKGGEAAFRALEREATAACGALTSRATSFRMVFCSRAAAW